MRSIEIGLDISEKAVSPPPRGHFETGVRDSLGPDNATIQRPLTWITEKLRAGQKPLSVLSPIWHVLAVSLNFFAVGLGEVLLLSMNTIWGTVLRVPTWIWMTSCLRRFQAVFTQHDPYDTIIGRRQRDYAQGKFFNILALTQNVLDGRKCHLPYHSKKTVARFDAEGSQFLKFCGFRSGMPRRESWALFRRLLVSPQFHVEFLHCRPTLKLIHCCLQRRLAILVWLGGLAVAVYVIGAPPIVLSFGVPLALLFQVSSLVNTQTRHAWFADAGETVRCDLYAARRVRRGSQR